ncbi:hypothetical protein [Arthrobacter sp.]|uniref:hypothetical protein n=1 Tax=Arthrobacter sp. TaxID=1667 RepID=UPI003A94E7A1
MGEDRKPDVKRVRLTGARFDGGRLPIDSLAELQKYQEVVRIAAEAEWRQAHPQEDLPGGFHDSVRLTIERIDEGSADVFLAFEQQQTYVQYQTEAQEAADAYIIAAYSDAPLPDLPSLTADENHRFREAVAHIGTTLEPEQSIEFYPGGPNSSPISITVETRANAADRLFPIEDFLLSPDPEPNIRGLQSSSESLTGRVTVLDADNKKFTLVLADGAEVHGWYRQRPELLEDFRSVVNSTVEGPLTRITGDLQTRDKKPFRFWEVASIERIEFDDTHWGDRLRDFAALPSRWDGDEAVQISSTALDAAQKLLQSVNRENANVPGVFPTEDGGVLIEWANAAGVRSVEILSDGSFEMFALRLDQREGQHIEAIDLTAAIAFVEGEEA